MSLQDPDPACMATQDAAQQNNSKTEVIISSVGIGDSVAGVQETFYRNSHRKCFAVMATGNDLS